MQVSQHLDPALQATKRELRADAPACDRDGPCVQALHSGARDTERQGDPVRAVLAFPDRGRDVPFIQGGLQLINASGTLFIHDVVDSRPREPGRSRNQVSGPALPDRRCDLDRSIRQVIEGARKPKTQGDPVP